MQDPYGGGESL